MIVSPGYNQLMQKTILITGATGGIGWELARLYGAQGYRLILVGRQEQAPSWEVPVLYCRADLAQRASADRVRLFLQQHGIESLDIVIHNAGVGYYGRLQAQSPQSIQELVAVNLRAPIALTHVLLPWVQRTHGQIVFVSSVAADLPTPDYAVYTATKAALAGFARSLRVELRGQVTVQVIYPGATRTGMHAKMGISRDTMDWEQFTPAAVVAAKMVQAIARKRPSATIGLTNSLLRWGGRKFGGVVDPLLYRHRFASMTTRPQPLHGRLHCVITGAADGIGRALAWQFGNAGYTITGIDVDDVRAQETTTLLAAHGIDIAFIQADLGQVAGIRHALWALSDRPPIDVFVHNAGINAVGRFTRLALPQQEAVLTVNLLAPLSLTAGIRQLGHMRPGGTWVFLSSLSYFVSYPGAAVYAASKDGLASFARSLRVVNDPPTNTLTIFPGPIRTGHAERYSPDNSREARRIPPANVAQAIFHAVQDGDTVLIPGAANRLLAAAGWLLPGVMEWGMARMILAKLGDRVMI